MPKYEKIKANLDGVSPLGKVIIRAVEVPLNSYMETTHNLVHTAFSLENHFTLKDVRRLAGDLVSPDSLIEEAADLLDASDADYSDDEESTDEYEGDDDEESDDDDDGDDDDDDEEEEEEEEESDDDEDDDDC